MRRRACLLLASCCLLACATTTENRSLGHFASSGFYNHALPYRVRYRDAEVQRILGPEWALANFVPVKKSRSRTVLEVAEVGEADDELVLLEDGDSLKRRRVYRHDLRFVHAGSGATIWLSSTPLPRSAAEASLYELTTRHLQAIEANGFPSAGLGAAQSRRFRSRELSQRDVRVDGLKAFETTFELLPVAGSVEPAQYVRVVVLRAPIEWRIDDARFRTLLILGFASDRPRFPKLVGDFARFANQLEVGYDDALRARTRQVLACTEPASEAAEVELEVSARGAISELEPGRPWVDPNAPVAKQTEQAESTLRDRRARAKACLKSALTGVKLLATGEPRELRMWFDAGVGPGVRSAGEYVTGPFTGEVIAAPPATPAPEPAAPVASEPTPSAPLAEAESDAALRAQLEAHAEALLACMGGKRVALELTYQDGQLGIELGDPLRGSPEQACVRQVLRELVAPAGAGRVIHVLSGEAR